MDNCQLLLLSSQNPESLYDPYYAKDSDALVIAENPLHPTQLQRSNQKLLELITAYKVLGDVGGGDKNIILSEIIKLLENDSSLNNSEFASFWAVNDVSFSLYKKLSINEKFAFIEEIVVSYIAKRHSLYSRYGYSDVTLQVKHDSFAHKRSGNQAFYKFENIIRSAGITFQVASNFSDYMSKDFCVIYPDKSDSIIFDLLLKNQSIPFLWGTNHDGKRPDFCIKCKDHFYIIEHKHMKEGGGGQNKQIAEIIDFISYDDSDRNTSYVVFVDGVLFNKILCNQGDKKSNTQYDRILENLKRCKSNYFLNTFGFQNFVKSIIIEQLQK